MYHVSPLCYFGGSARSPYFSDKYLQHLMACNTSVVPTNTEPITKGVDRNMASVSDPVHLRHTS